MSKALFMIAVTKNRLAMDSPNFKRAMDSTPDATINKAFNILLLAITRA